jgi:hypothetical protein
MRFHTGAALLVFVAAALGLTTSRQLSACDHEFVVEAVAISPDGTRL